MFKSMRMRFTGHAWGLRKMRIDLYLENVEDRDQLQDVPMYVRIKLKCILKGIGVFCEGVHWM
jgi:hypothetical protein